MGVMRNCSDCGHAQMIGHNPVDGRLKWWTSCEKCRKGNFMAPIDDRTLRMLAWATKRARERKPDPSSTTLDPAGERLAGGARPNPEDAPPVPAPSDERGEAA